MSLPRARRTALVLALLWLAPAGPAQVGPRSEPPSPRVLIAAGRRSLWLARVDRPMTVLFRRPLAGPFDLGRPLDQPIVRIATLDDDCLACLPNGELYRWFGTQARPVREREIPGRRPPLDLLGAGGRIYALIAPPPATRPGPTTRESTLRLGRVRPDRLTVTSQPAAIPPGRALVVVSDGTAWGLLFAAPAGVALTGDPRLDPKLWVLDDRVLLFSSVADQAVRLSVRGRTEATWRETGIFATPHVRGFWPVDLAGVPALVIAQGGSDGPRVRVFRLLGNVAQPVPQAWRQLELRWSEQPDNVRLVEVRAAVGFNQHIALLWISDDGQPYLRFGAPGAPTEPTLAIEALWKHQTSELRSRTAWQALTIAVMLAVLIGLFVFRRDALTRVLALPADVAIATGLRRLLAWAIDVAPFVIAAARVAGMDVRSALLGLARWGLSPDVEAAYPSPELLRFWLLAAVGHTAYCLVMELLTFRTVGKVLLGLAVAGEDGRPPRRYAVLWRNLSRLIELLPQFWVFVLIVPFSRNRQRLGDLLARTIIIRRLRPGSAPPQRG